MKGYLKLLKGEKYILPLLLITIIVGIAGVYNLGWNIKAGDDPLIFIIIGWVVSIIPTPVLLLRSYLIYKKTK
mgnify:CR=1 FL=1